tara:strand:+ start:1097 stop:1369 length:273 start_codon:yes stop_codon:yes gene_type:complete
MGLKPRREFKWSLDSGRIKEHIESKGGELIWESQNGRKNLVKQLDLNHLKNILKLFDKKEYIDDSIFECLESELIYRTLTKNKEDEQGTE